jgi:toxin CptA
MTGSIERPALVIRPGVSRRLALWVLIAHGLTLATIALLPVSLTGRAGLVLAVLLGCALSLGGAVWHFWPWSLREAVWWPDGAWSLIRGDGRERDGRLLGSTYVSPALVVLNFRCGRWRTASLVLLPDNLEPDLLRRLRVRLRLEGVRRGKEAMAVSASESPLR